jgi:predicted Zn-dependent protease
LEDIALEIRKILFAQRYALPKRSIADLVLPRLLDLGPSAAALEYHRLKTSRPNQYDFGVKELYQLAQRLMAAHRPKDAIAMLNLDLESYPNESHLHGSLADDYLEAGEARLARASYERVLSLDPENLHAKEMLNQLSGHNRRQE